MDTEGDAEPSPPRALPNRSRERQGHVTPPTSYEFVSSDDRSQIRSHAMRESWRQRNQRAGKQPSRATPPKRPFPEVPAVDIGESPASAPGTPSEDDRLPPRETIFVDFRHTLSPPRRTNSAAKWKVSSLPGPLSSLSIPSQSLLGNDALDSFSCLQLDTNDQKLLFHCELNPA